MPIYIAFIRSLFGKRKVPESFPIMRCCDWLIQLFILTNHNNVVSFPKLQNKETKNVICNMNDWLYDK